MSKSNPFVSTLALSGALVIALLAGAGIAWAEEHGPAAISPPGRGDSPQIEHFEYWQVRADAARAHLAVAQAELDEANAAVSRMRRNNHPRGEARVAIREEQTRAQAAFDEARQALEVELPAEARAAGAQQHWLRERR